MNIYYYLNVTFSLSLLCCCYTSIGTEDTTIESAFNMLNPLVHFVRCLFSLFNLGNQSASCLWNCLSKFFHRAILGVDLKASLRVSGKNALCYDNGINKICVMSPVLSWAQVYLRHMIEIALLSNNCNKFMYTFICTTSKK